TDPREGKNLLTVRGQVGIRMRERLRGLDARAARAAPILPPGAGTMERMAALGYVGGSARRTGGEPDPDPKDKVGEFQAFTRGTRQGVRLFEAGDYDRAIAVL